MRKNKLLFIIYLILMLVVLTGCENKSNQELLIDKGFAEMEYIENKVLVIVKNYFTGEYLDENNETDWKKVEDEFSGVINNSNIMVIDLASLSINNDLIVNLENKINNVFSSIQSKTESNFIGSLKDLYDLVPQFLDKYYYEKDVVKIKYVKSGLLDSLYFYIIGDYESANNSINLAQDRYLELSKDKEFLEKNAYKINKDYVSIQEMKEAINSQEVKNVLQKYLNTLEI